MELKLPNEVRLILNELKNKGFEAYVVGGCVRDSLMGRIPKDWDIATGSTPHETKAIFESAGYKTIPTGLKHGTVAVLAEKLPYELTTFRIDGNYVDGRRPENVLFTASITEDLSRRDFTINAMAYNEVQGLIDPFNGQKDISSRTLRCVGNPEQRFNEDALRMLRAIRLSSELDFSIHEDTLRAISKNSVLISKISYERIREEFNKILLSNPHKVKLLDETGLLAHILPEFTKCLTVSQDNPYHIYNVGEHILVSTEAAQKDLILRLTMLFHDIGKPLCKTIDESGRGHFYGHDRISTEIAIERLKIMKYDNITIKRVGDLITYHDNA